MASDFSRKFHIDVVSDVINKFSDDAIFNQLQALWEMRMVQCGVIRPNYAEQPGPNSTPIQTPVQTPLPDMDFGPSDYASNSYWSDVKNNKVDDVKYGVPSPYMAPVSPWMNTRPLGVDINVAYVEGQGDANREGTNHNSIQEFLALSKRKRDEYSANINSINNNNYIMPQQDESDYCAVEFEVNDNQISKSKRPNSSSSSVFPQLDGVNDKYEPNSDEETNLNDDDDDDDDDDDENDDVCEDLVLCQFCKVQRTKNIWKCNLKNGIMHLNGKDIPFNTAMGNFDF